MGVARIQEMGAVLIQEISAMKNFQVIAAARFFLPKTQDSTPYFSASVNFNATTP